MAEWGTNAGSTFDDHYRLVAGRLLWRHELAAILDGDERAGVAVVDQTTESRLLTVVISLTVRGTEDERAVFAEYVRAAADVSRVQAIGGAPEHMPAQWAGRRRSTHRRRNLAGQSVVSAQRAALDCFSS